MTIFAQDSFTGGPTRVDLTNHTPEIGGSWLLTNSYFSGSITIYEEGYTAALQRVGVAWLGDSASNNRAGRFISTLPDGPDVIVEGTLTGSSSSSDACFLLFRADPDRPISYYAVGLESGGRYLAIRKFLYSDGGGGTLAVFHQLQPGTNFNPRRVRVECISDEIKAYVDDVLETSWIDPEPMIRTGRVGVGGSKNTSVDDFVARNPSAEPEPIVYSSTVAASAGVALAEGTGQARTTPISDMTNSNGRATVAGSASSIVTKETTGTASGSSTNTFQSFAYQTGFGDCEAAASAAAISVEFVTREAVGQSDASATSNYRFLVIAPATFSADGLTTSDFMTATLMPFVSEFTAAGAATVQAESKQIIAAVGSSTGRTILTQFGAANLLTITSQGFSEGSAFVEGIRWGTISEAQGFAEGTCEVRSMPQAPTPAKGRSLARAIISFRTGRTLEADASSDSTSEGTFIGMRIDEALGQSFATSFGEFFKGSTSTDYAVAARRRPVRF
ncbi:hypothetical protein vBCbaSRXM_154 [Citromicrobium phage vB_CbaS-RXM]|nr:hypothetical protein vBCbaSRXM_154 [Citromicrobium phage vB_CbaS-RXM]